MNILIISTSDNDGKYEDILIAEAFKKDGHNVELADKNYENYNEDLYDVFLMRNSWLEDATIDMVNKESSLIKKIISKNLPRINFDGKFDGNGKEYLVDLFKQKYLVIPSVDNLEEINLLGNCSKYVLKLKESYDAIGQIVVNRKDLAKKFNNSYIIQPFMKFKSEVQFYYIKDKFEYALEFVPSKIPIYPDAKKYQYNSNELELANSFAKLNGDYYGIQRIDFIKLADNSLLLTEIEDISPYLDLDCVDEKTKKEFLYDYKKMVYEYMHLIDGDKII